MFPDIDLLLFHCPLPASESVNSGLLGSMSSASSIFWDDTGFLVIVKGWGAILQALVSLYSSPVTGNVALSSHSAHIYDSGLDNMPLLSCFALWSNSLHLFASRDHAL